MPDRMAKSFRVSVPDGYAVQDRKRCIPEGVPFSAITLSVVLGTRAQQKKWQRTLRYLSAGLSRVDLVTTIGDVHVFRVHGVEPALERLVTLSNVVSIELRDLGLPNAPTALAQAPLPKPGISPLADLPSLRVVDTLPGEALKKAQRTGFTRESMNEFRQSADGTPSHLVKVSLPWTGEGEYCI